MALIIYALSGQGRGHASRAAAITLGLRARGHQVSFCCGGTAHAVLTAQGEEVLYVPSLKHVMQGNRLRPLATLRENTEIISGGQRIIDQLAVAFWEHDADLVISDFEFFSSRAARAIGLPVLSFDNQQILTQASCAVPVRYCLQAALARLAITLIAPRNARHVVISSFFSAPLKRPERVTLVPPIIRPEVRDARTAQHDHVLVYYTEGHDLEGLIRTLARVDARFMIYNIAPPNDAVPDNLVFKQPSDDGFLHDLATCRAILCTAGFTLISEALYLDKPLLVAPNGGIFEQTLNALYVAREGFGEAVFDRPLVEADVTGFLSRVDRYAEKVSRQIACGNEQALECIERFVGGPVRSPVVDGSRAPYVPCGKAVGPI